MEIRVRFCSNLRTELQEDLMRENMLTNMGSVLIVDEVYEIVQRGAQTRRRDVNR